MDHQNLKKGGNKYHQELYGTYTTDEETLKEVQ